MWNNAPGNPAPGNQPAAPKSSYTAYDDFKPVVPSPQHQQHAAHNGATLGAGLSLKGELTGQEDVYLDCKVEGPVSFGGNRVTIGSSSVVNGNIVAREAVLHGKLSGDLLAHDRVEVKKGGALVGDLVTGRISIEEGAYFKGHIEVDPGNKASKS